MSEHTPLTEAMHRLGKAAYGNPDANERQVDDDWDLIHDALAARTSTATADTGLRERVEAAETAVERVRAIGNRWAAEAEERGPSDQLWTRGAAAMILAALPAPTTDTGARDE